MSSDTPIAKYRKDGHPGEWWLTDFTMEQVEGRLAAAQEQIAALKVQCSVIQRENSALKAENERLRGCIARITCGWTQTGSSCPIAKAIEAHDLLRKAEQEEKR